MFNPFFRSYLPGFRVGPDGVPGFNIDDYGLPRRTTASFDDALAGSEAQRDPDAGQAQSPPDISFHLPGAEGWVLSAPLIGSPGFSVDPQDEVPGFNVRPQDDAPGFNIDENGVPRQQTTWSAGVPPGSATPPDVNAPQTPPSLPGNEEPAPSAPLQLPEWLYKLGTMLPPQSSTVFDPRIERPTAINSPPGLGSVAAAPGANPWPPSSAPQQPADIGIRSRAGRTPDIYPQSAAQQAMRTAWLQPLQDGRPDVPARAALPLLPPIPPLADSNFSLANAGDSGGQKAQQQMPLAHYQQAPPRMPSALLSTGPATVRPPEAGNIKLAGFDPKSDQEFSQLIEAYRQLKEADGKPPSSDRPPPPPLNENGVSSYAAGNDGSSLGQRLVRGSIDTLVPGAHYQALARQQLGAGNYVGAGVYQAAALADAALGIATFGLGPKLTAAGRTAAAEGVSLFRRVFNSERQLKDFLGKVPKGMHWHHIVEKNKAVQFGQQRIHSIENIVALPEKEHNQLSGFYASKQPYSEDMRVRHWLRGQSFEEQYEFGMKQLKRVLGY